jgi:hypothetical protein
MLHVLRSLFPVLISHSHEVWLLSSSILSGFAVNRPRGTKVAAKLVYWESKSKSLFRFTDFSGK